MSIALTDVDRIDSFKGAHDDAPGQNVEDDRSVSDLLRENGERVLGINGQDFPATDKTFNYAVWLTSPTKVFRLGFVGGGVAGSGKNKGRLVTGAVPSQIAKAGTTAAEKTANKATAASIKTALADFYTYKELIITREPAGKDSKTPGTTVVSGAIVKPK